jgi:hypothetical protein
MREKQILARLGEGEGHIPAKVETMYRDIDPRLHPAAGRSVLAHRRSSIPRSGSQRRRSLGAGRLSGRQLLAFPAKVPCGGGYQVCARSGPPERQINRGARRDRIRARLARGVVGEGRYRPRAAKEDP